MAGVLENHIIFMVLESFLGLALLPLLAGCVRFWMIFTGCVAAKQMHLSIFLHLLMTVFPVYVLGGGSGSFIKSPLLLYFLVQLNNGNLVMSFVAQILSIWIKEKNLLSGV